MRILVAGALGEVGRTVSAALRDLGHDVVAASSRAPFADGSVAVAMDEAEDLVRVGAVDAVVSAAGPGDRRGQHRPDITALAALAAAAHDADVPAVLLSTTRVLEGWEGPTNEEAAPNPLTDYARANASNEDAWLSSGGSSVLRITNYLAAPASTDTPQTGLLPWSLLTEALDRGTITIRSGPSLTKEFVDAHDVARAVTLLASAANPPRLCWTAPGSPFSLRELAEDCCEALGAVRVSTPQVTFGEDAPATAAFPGGWLQRQGWTSSLTNEDVVGVMAEWLRSVRLH